MHERIAICVLFVLSFFSNGDLGAWGAYTCALSLVLYHNTTWLRFVGYGWENWRFATKLQVYKRELDQERDYIYRLLDYRNWN
jgi:hypothetical protein